VKGVRSVATCFASDADVEDKKEKLFHLCFVYNDVILLF